MYRAWPTELRFYIFTYTQITKARRPGLAQWLRNGQGDGVAVLTHPCCCPILFTWTDSHTHRGQDTTLGSCFLAPALDSRAELGSSGLHPLRHRALMRTNLICVRRLPGGQMLISGRQMEQRLYPDGTVLCIQTPHESVSHDHPELCMCPVE